MTCDDDLGLPMPNALRGVTTISLMNRCALWHLPTTLVI
jgi:hypothetical protein